MDSILAYLMDRIMILPGIIVGLCFHEFAHAKVSNMLGDPTPEYQGRVTLNPMAHIDPMGFICLMFFGFGWGKPVAINPTYYKRRRGGEIMVGLAGVVMNLLIAIAGMGILRLLYQFAPVFLMSQTGSIINQIIVGLIQINIVLMFFNLIPLPPLDGFGVVTNIFRLERKSWFPKFYRMGPMILMLAIIFDLTSKVLSPLVSGTYMMLVGIFFGI